MNKRIIYVLMFFMCLVLFTGTASAAHPRKTEDEAIAWVLRHMEGIGYDYDGHLDNKAAKGNGKRKYYTNQCVDLIRGYMDYISGTHTNGDAGQYTWKPLPAGYTRIQKYDGFVPQRGDILIWEGDPGHVAIVTAVENEHSVKYTDQNGQSVDGISYTKKIKHNRTMDPATDSYWGVIRPDFQPEIAQGSMMISSSERVLSDGEYQIAIAGTDANLYYLDIQGDIVPAVNGENVSICGPVIEPKTCEIWTISYGDDGFYTIRLTGTDMCLDVYGGNTAQGTNVEVFTANDSDAQKWAISLNGQNGYLIQPKCSGGGESGMCLAVEEITDKANVMQWQISNSDSQSWRFIPYWSEQAAEEPLSTETDSPQP